MYHVYVMFPWGISDVFLRDFTFVCTGYQGVLCHVRMTYVWRMKCTREVSTACVLRSIIICGVSLFCTNCFLIPVRTSGCVHFVHAIRTLQLPIIRGRRCHRRNLDNLD